MQERAQPTHATRTRGGGGETRRQVRGTCPERPLVAHVVGILDSSPAVHLMVTVQPHLMSTNISSLSPLSLFPHNTFTAPQPSQPLAPALLAQESAASGKGSVEAADHPHVQYDASLLQPLRDWRGTAPGC